MCNEQFSLSESEWDMVIEALDALKQKDLASNLLTGLFTDVILRPKKDAPVSEQIEWEKRKEKRELEEQAKEEEKKKVNKKIDFLKAKITILKGNN